MIACRLAIAASLLSAHAVPSLAQAPAAPAAPVWQVDWGNYYCSLIRLPSNDVPFTIMLQAIPGTLSIAVNILRRGDELLPRTVSSVAVLPSGQVFGVNDVLQQMRGGGTRLHLSQLPNDFWEALAGATELQLRNGANTVRRIPLTDARRAVRSVRECESDIMRRWGIDEAALRALQQWPFTTNRYGIQGSDYPLSALDDGDSGRTVARITVSPEGRATDCAVVATSGSRHLDETTCRVVLRRGRFRRPLDANGRPTSVRMTIAVAWIVV